jgi:hypothetical protein
MSRPQPENYGTAWGYFWAHRRWKQAHGGSLIVNVAVAAIAGGITGSQLAVVVFIVLAVVVTLARRRARERPCARSKLGGGRILSGDGHRLRGVSGAPTSREDWSGQLQGATLAPVARRVKFIAPSEGGGSQAFPAVDEQMERWYVKAPNNPQGGRVVVTELIVSAAGQLIGAPVCEVELIEISAEFAGMKLPSGLTLQPGIGSASRAIPDVAQEGTLAHRQRDDNQRRHVGVFALYDWCWGGDGQWLYCASADKKIYSHDHGWYLPPEGANWDEGAMMAEVGTPRPLPAPHDELDPAECERIADALAAVSREDLCSILAGVPQQWGVPVTELEAVGYFLECRAPAVGARIRALGAQP